MLIHQTIVTLSDMIAIGTYDDHKAQHVIQQMPAEVLSAQSTEIPTVLVEKLNGITTIQLAQWSRALWFIAQRTTNPLDYATALWYRGIASFINTDYEDALRVLMNAHSRIQSVAISQKTNWLAARISYTLAYVYYHKNLIHEAIPHITVAIKLFLEQHNDELWERANRFNDILQKHKLYDGSCYTRDQFYTELVTLHQVSTPKKRKTAVRTSTAPVHSALYENLVAQPHHQPIAAGETGWSYDRLFGEYLRGATHIKLYDPWIRTFYQIKDLHQFIDTVSRYADVQHGVKVHLVTGYDDKSDDEKQQERLSQTRIEARKKRIEFDWEYDQNLHDRWMVIDHTHWKILLGKGLSIYAPFPRQKYNSMLSDLSLRPCVQCQITYLADF